MSRRRQPALAVPTTDEGAIALLATYGEVEREIRLSAERADAAVAAAKKVHDDFVAGVADLQKGRFAALKAWWEAGGAQRMAGKKRSAELAGAKIGIRLSPMSVRLPKGTKIETIVEWLLSLRWIGKTRFLRTKITLDKDALISAWDDEPVVRDTFGRAGVSVGQSDEFFIDVGPAEASA